MDLALLALLPLALGAGDAAEARVVVRGAISVVRALSRGVDKVGGTTDGAAEPALRVLARRGVRVGVPELNMSKW